MNKKLEPPEKTIGDRVHTVVRTIISSVPEYGGAAGELFNMVIAPPLEKRRDEWMREISDALQGLEKRVSGFTVAALSTNETFIDLILQATQSALRNSSKEKRRALRNAVLNASLSSHQDVMPQQIFVRLLDSLTERHIQVLAMLAAPADWFRAMSKDWPGISQPGMSSVEDAALEWITGGFDDLKASPELAKFLLKDLANHGLVKLERFQLVWGNDPRKGCATELGKTFLGFIQEPGK